MYQYSMNVHVLDAKQKNVPGANVTVSVNGSPKVGGKTRGYLNAPMKLRFNSEAPSVCVKAEYKDEQPVETTVSSSDRDVTLVFPDLMLPEINDEERNRFAKENWAALIFGMAMLVVLFVSPLILPKELPAYLGTVYPKILLTILALCGAGFAAALTGFILLEIGKKDAQYRIRAGGALAVFLVVFFWNPAGL